MEHSSTARSSALAVTSSAPSVLMTHHQSSASDGEHRTLVLSAEPSILIMHHNDYETHVVISRDDSSRSSLRPGYGLCRICHVIDKVQKLVSPCHCKGSMLYVHKACLERWLETRSIDTCELCHFQYTTEKIPMRFREWLGQHSGPLRKRLIEDSIFTLALTAVTLCVATSVFVALSHLDLPNEEGYASPWWQRVLQTFLSGDLTLLMAVYLYWTARTIRHHYNTFRAWRQTHFHVKLLLEPSASNHGIHQLLEQRSSQTNTEQHGVGDEESVMSVFDRTDHGSIIVQPLRDQEPFAEDNNVETVI